MNLRRTLSTARRVLMQLKHDRRTLALIFFMPTILLVVLYYVFNDSTVLFNDVAPLLLGIIPFTLMFIVTSVAVLRERTSGTLERLLTSPASPIDILLGYAIAFAIMASLQAAIATVIAITWLNVSVEGATSILLLIAVLAGVLGMAFGLLFSAFAKNEFQAVQFMPAFVLPQFLTCGLFTPRENMAAFVRYFSDVMPITYIVEAVQQVQHTAQWTGDLTINLLVVGGFVLFALVLGALSLRQS